MKSNITKMNGQQHIKKKVSTNVLIVINIHEDDTKNAKCSAVKHWLLLSDFSEMLICKWDFRKIHKLSEMPKG